MCTKTHYMNELRREEREYIFFAFHSNRNQPVHLSQTMGVVFFSQRLAQRTSCRWTACGCVHLKELFEGLHRVVWSPGCNPLKSRTWVVLLSGLCVHIHMLNVCVVSCFRFFFSFLLWGQWAACISSVLFRISALCEIMTVRQEWCDSAAGGSVLSARSLTGAHRAHSTFLNPAACLSPSLIFLYPVLHFCRQDNSVTSRFKLCFFGSWNASFFFFFCWACTFFSSNLIHHVHKYRHSYNSELPGTLLSSAAGCDRKLIKGVSCLRAHSVCWQHRIY